MKTVLFACVHNAGRSQMAAAFFNAAADRGLARAISAGTEPAESVHPEVVATMREVGLELGGASPTFLSLGVARSADLLVTMGCGDVCPLVPGLQRLDWNLPDPRGRPAPEVRAIRDEIRAQVTELLSGNDWLRKTG